MKRKLIIAASFILMASAFTACTDGIFQNCKMCATNTYEGGTLVIPGSEAEYCDAALIAKEATPDIPVGAQIIKVECH